MDYYPLDWREKIMIFKNQLLLLYIFKVLKNKQKNRTVVSTNAYFIQQSLNLGTQVSSYPACGVLEVAQERVSDNSPSWK